MKKLFLTLSLAILFANLFAQTKKLENLYYFKTVDDFFAGNKVYLGKVVSDKDCGKFTLRDSVSGKDFKVKLLDSSYAGYGFDNNLKMYADRVEKCFYTYIAGNKNILIYFKGTLFGVYDKNGEMTAGSLFIDDSAWLYYVKDLDQKNKKYKFYHMLADNPTLLKQFQDETKADNKLYERNFLDIHRRYIKLYMDQLKK